MPHPNMVSPQSLLLAALLCVAAATALGSCAPGADVALGAEASLTGVAAALPAPAPVGSAAPAADVAPTDPSDSASAGEAWSPPPFERPASPLEGILAMPPGTLPPLELTPKGDLGSATLALKRGDLPTARREVDAYLSANPGRDAQVLGLYVRAHLEEAQGAHRRAAETYSSIRNGTEGLRAEIARGEGRALVQAGEALQGAQRLKAAAEATPEGSFKEARLIEAADAFALAGHSNTAIGIYDDVLTRISGGLKEAVELKRAKAQLLRGPNAEAVETLHRLSATATDCDVSSEATVDYDAQLPNGDSSTALSRELQRVERMTECRRFDDAQAHLKLLSSRADSDALEDAWLRLWYAQWDLKQIDAYTNARLKGDIDDIARSRLTRWAAKAAWRMGEPGKAADLRWGSVTRGGGKPDVGDKFAIGLLYAEAHQFDKSKPLLEDVLSERPTRRQRIESMWYLAWGSLLQGDHPDAKRRLVDLSERYSDEERGQAAMYWLGRLALLDAQGDEALSWFRKVQESSSDSFYGFLIRSLRLDQAADSTVAAAKVPPALIPRPVAELALDGKTAALTSAGQSHPLALPTISPWRTMFPTVPEATSTPYLNLPSPLRQETPADLLAWEAEGRLALEGLNRTYGALSPELRIAQGLSEAGFRHEAGPWLEDARSKARKATDPRLNKLGRELTSFHQAYWYVDHPLEALRTDPTGWPFPSFDVGNTDTLEKWKRRYPRVYASEVSRAHHSWGVDPSLIYGIMRTESMFGADQVSGVGARGLMQIMPATGSKIAALLGDGFSEDDLFNPGRNVWYGAWYLGQLLQRFNGQLPVAAAAYNAGPTYVSTWVTRLGPVPIDVFIEEVPLRQTRQYVKKVLRAMALYRGLYANAEPLPLRAVLDTTPRAGVDF